MGLKTHSPHASGSTTILQGHDLVRSTQRWDAALERVPVQIAPRHIPSKIAT